MRQSLEKDRGQAVVRSRASASYLFLLNQGSALNEGLALPEIVKRYVVALDVAAGDPEVPPQTPPEVPAPTPTTVPPPDHSPDPNSAPPVKAHLLNRA
jgi:hypothetical protein